MFSGEWIDRIIGLDNVTVETVMARAPDRRRRPRPRGRWETVGEIVDFESTFLLCYVRGPDGVIVELAERLDGAASPSRGTSVDRR